MSLTLSDLLKDLEAEVGLNKQAAEDEKDSKEGKDKKGDPETKERKEEGDAKSNLFKAEKEVEEAEKDNKKEQEECTKEASAKGAALAQEVMARVKSAGVAQTTTQNKESDMKKEASVAGKALADALLEKLAAAGDVSTVNGTVAGTVPQKAIADSAQIVAEDDNKVKPTPGTDGMHGGGSINQILDAIVQDTISQGATAFGQNVEAKARNAAEAEGVVEDHAVPNQVEDEDEREKAAAVSALVDDGYDFASAVEMVKAAAEEIEYEETVQLKQAALGALLDRGVDFDNAVAMVKSAAAILPAGVSRTKQMFRAAAGTAKDAVGAMGKKTKIGIGAAAGAGAAAGVAGAALGREKKAAFDALVDAGVDFDQALALVQAKSMQLYGK
jgi:hypothetical protein